MDIFKEINGNNFQKRLVDFGDVYLLDKVQRKNIFWQDVFFSFMCFMKKKMNQKLCNTKYIFIIPVWYTFGIKIGGKHFLIEILNLNRVTTCGDFLNKNGIILSRKDFRERFHLSHIPPMQYNSIKSAISKNVSFCLLIGFQLLICFEHILFNTIHLGLSSPHFFQNSFGGKSRNDCLKSVLFLQYNLKISAPCRKLHLAQHDCFNV